MILVNMYNVLLAQKFQIYKIFIIRTKCKILKYTIAVAIYTYNQHVLDSHSKLSRKIATWLVGDYHVVF